MAQCRVDGCGREANVGCAARGLCVAHYRRRQNHGDENAPVRITRATAEEIAARTHGSPTSACPRCGGPRVWNRRFLKNGTDLWQRFCWPCRQKGNPKTERDKAMERLRQHRKRRTPEGRAYGLWNNAKSRAKEKGWEFTLTIETIEKAIASGVCQVSGMPFDLSSDGYKQSCPRAPSLDRKDSSKGYTEENVQVVCWIYNMAKQAWGHEDVMALARALVGND